jgi:hypothetical protein
VYILQAQYILQVVYILQAEYILQTVYILQAEYILQDVCILQAQYIIQAVQILPSSKFNPTACFCSTVLSCRKIGRSIVSVRTCSISIDGWCYYV